MHAWRSSLAAGIGLVTTLAVLPARGEVISIGADGTAVRYDRPTQFTRAGAVVIEAARSPQRPSERAMAAQQARLMAPAALVPVILAAARAHGVDAALIDAVAHQESRYRYDAVSPRGALGVMQLMPGTARMLGVDPYDVTANVHGGAAYLRMMLDRYGGDRRLALAAYNAGPGAVDRYGGIPPFAETRAYVAAIERGLVHRQHGNAGAGAGGNPTATLLQTVARRPPEVLTLGTDQ
jgi:soluble lytic murein transglycosylase-like protein